MEKVIPAAEAKTNFGALLEKVQREPLTISKKGRLVAVLMSMDEFETHQRLKLKQLRLEIQAGLADLEAGKVVDGAKAFEAIDRELGD
ncbi:MAG: type II toxin-antitoxin system Phd/YefM family antitoxin [Gammaproteobacteria bacterium]|nr:type II toxin-antitoxin system Phd/YefM family antitoxin [Gammaproteobacteria bacterium]